MSHFQVMLRMLTRLVRHPVVQASLKHAIRLGTRELVREVQRRTRPSAS